jgi:hypothetical protein
MKEKTKEELEKERQLRVLALQAYMARGCK